MCGPAQAKTAVSPSDIASIGASASPGTPRVVHIHIFLSEDVGACVAPIPAIRGIPATRVHFVQGLSTLMPCHDSGQSLTRGHRFRRPIFARDQFEGKNCDDLKKRKPAEAGFRKVEFL